MQNKSAKIVHHVILPYLDQICHLSLYDEYGAHIHE